jgi:hypothetical protein
VAVLCGRDPAHESIISEYWLIVEQHRLRILEQELDQATMDCSVAGTT